MKTTEGGKPHDYAHVKAGGQGVPTKATRRLDDATCQAIYAGNYQKARKDFAARNPLPVFPTASSSQRDPTCHRDGDGQTHLRLSPAENGGANSEHFGVRWAREAGQPK